MGVWGVWGRLVICLTVMTLLLTGSPGRAVPAANVRADLSPHPLIYIRGNGAFTAANGVTGGSGTPTDPYVIQGWDIDVGAGTGIEVTGTTAYFIIRHVATHAVTQYGGGFAGINLHQVTNATISGVSVGDSTIGVYLSQVGDARVLGVNTTPGTGSRLSYAVDVESSKNVTIGGSTIQASETGIYLYFSTSLQVVNNTLLDTGQAIHLIGSSDATVAGNVVSGQGSFGIYLEGSYRVTLTANQFEGRGVYLYGQDVAAYDSHAIGPDNLVNGLPLYYYKDCHDLVVDGGTVGQLLVANCQRVQLSHLTIADTDIAIELAMVTGARVSENRLRDNGDGLDLIRSTNVTVASNTIEGQRWAGVYLEGSAATSILGNEVARSQQFGAYVQASDHTIVADNIFWHSSSSGLFLCCSSQFQQSTDTWVFHNSFLSEPYARPAGDDGGVRTSWNAGYPGGGNFWSDYTGVDGCHGPAQDNCTGADGIGDTPYVINPYWDSLDPYPLMEPSVPLSFFPFPFVVDGVVQADFFLGASNSHPPASNASTIDVVGGIPVAASLARGTVGLPRAFLDEEVVGTSGGNLTFQTGDNVLTVGGRGVNLVTRYYNDAAGAKGLPIRMVARLGLCTTDRLGSPLRCYHRQGNYSQGLPVVDYGYVAMLYDQSQGHFVLAIAGLSGYATRATAQLVALHSGTLLTGTGTIVRLMNFNGDGRYESFQVIDGTGGFQAMALPEALPQPINISETLVVGLSQPHGVARAAHTIDVVGAIPLAAHEVQRLGGNVWGTLDVDVVDGNATVVASGVGDVISIGGRGVNLLTRYYNDRGLTPVRVVTGLTADGSTFYRRQGSYFNGTSVVDYAYWTRAQDSAGRNAVVLAGLSGYATRGIAFLLAQASPGVPQGSGIIVALKDDLGNGNYSTYQVVAGTEGVVVQDSPQPFPSPYP